MTEEILPGIFVIKIPLPGSPLQAINAYLIKGNDRSLLVDTGFNRPECKSALVKSLADLGVAENRIDYFITHMHADHCGLAGEMSSGRSSRLFCNLMDAEVIYSAVNGTFLADVMHYLFENGLPTIDYRPVNEAVKGSISPIVKPIVGVRDGDVLSYGGYELSCVVTPGHTMGHTCLFESKHRILFGGDLILADITPNIGIACRPRDDLGLYFQSLERVRGLDIKIVLPGHRNPITDHRARVQEIKEHHQQRLQEIMSALGPDPVSAFDIAGMISWDTRQTWDELPYFQKYFAVGEVVAHLRYLLNIGKLRTLKLESKSLFRIS